LQGRLTGAALQRDIGGTPVKAGIAGFPGGIQDQLEAQAGLAAARVDLTQQQLVEELPVQRRIGFGERLRVGILCQQRRHRQQAGGQGNRDGAEGSVHRTIIIQATAPWCPTLS